MVKVKWLIVLPLILTSICVAQTPIDMCQSQQQAVILQYVKDQATILQSAGVFPLRGLTQDESSQFLQLWAKAFIATSCIVPSGTSTGTDTSGTSQRLGQLENTINGLLNGPAVISDLKVTKGQYTGQYTISWTSKPASLGKMTWGYVSGTYSNTSYFDIGITSVFLYANPGSTIYIKFQPTQIISGVSSTTNEFSLTVPR